MQIIYNIKKKEGDQGGSDYEMQCLRKGKPFATQEQVHFVNDLIQQAHVIQEQLDRAKPPLNNKAVAKDHHNVNLNQRTRNADLQE